MVSPTRTPVTKNQRPAQMTGVSTQRFNGSLFN